MDNVPRPAYAFGPSRPIAVAIAAGAVIAAAAAALSSDRGGRLLLGCVAIALAAIAIADLVFWPRLRADGSGITIFTPSLRTHLAWSEVDVMRVDHHLHHGLTNRALEIESGDRLIVFSRRALGGDPRDAFDQIHGLRPDLPSDGRPTG